MCCVKVHKYVHKKAGPRALRGFPSELSFFNSLSYLREKRADHCILVDAMTLTVPFPLIWHSRRSCVYAKLAAISVSRCIYVPQM